ncbi:MAG: nuclear transport factor 2 family protein [Bacteroidota bacterium]
MVQTLVEKSNIEKVVTSLFVATDENDWSQVEKVFDKLVILDYTSLAGGTPLSLHPYQIADSWKSVLPGFDHTHHMISNFQIEVSGHIAEVKHYGFAQHYLDDNIWTVVGTYRHKLRHTNDGWKIYQLQFNLKYMTGNMDLPRFAKERLTVEHV